MADNVLYTQGSGISVATDDVGGIHFQKIKIDIGGDGASIQPAGSIPVYMVSGTGAYLMNDPFIDAVAIGGQMDDVSTVVATEGNVTPTRSTVGRALHVNLRNAMGIEISSGTNPLIVSGTTFTVITGDFSAGAVDGGQPIKMGGVVYSGLPNPLATGQRGNIILDVYGRQRVVPERKPILGNYKFESGRLTIGSGAHTTFSGFFWLINPVGSTVVASVKKMFATSVPTSPVTCVSSPRITIERITFTGTASGATITQGARDSKDAAPICSVRTANTGMTITAGAILGDFTVPMVISGAMVATPTDQWFYDVTDEDDYLVIRAGEGIVIRQADIGSIGDTRLLIVFGAWEER